MIITTVNKNIDLRKSSNNTTSGQMYRENLHRTWQIVEKNFICSDPFNPLDQDLKWQPDTPKQFGANTNLSRRRPKQKKGRLSQATRQSAQAAANRGFDEVRRRMAPRLDGRDGVDGRRLAGCSPQGAPGGRWSCVAPPATGPRQGRRHEASAVDRLKPRPAGSIVARKGELAGLASEALPSPGRDGPLVPDQVL